MNCSLLVSFIDGCLELYELYKIPLYLLVYSCYAYFKIAISMKTEDKKQKKYKFDDLCYWILRPPECPTVRVLSDSLDNFESCTIGADDLYSLYDPFVSFLDGTKCTLDMAFMTFGSVLICNKLVELHRRGVRIRVILDLKYNSDNSLAVDLAKKGIQVMYFHRNRPERETIFHWKFMLRDYKKSNSCVYVGSANLTNTAYTKKTENFLFTSNDCVIRTLQEQFNFYWYLIPLENDPVKRYVYSVFRTKHTISQGKLVPFQTNYKDIFKNCKYLCD